MYIIAHLSGVFKVGLNESDLLELARPDTEKHKLKISRRDIAYAAVTRATGGTTVSGTMILAAAAGIHFFATGGMSSYIHCQQLCVIV